MKKIMSYSAIASGLAEAVEELDVEQGPFLSDQLKARMDRDDEKSIARFGPAVHNARAGSL